MNLKNNQFNKSLQRIANSCAVVPLLCSTAAEFCRWVVRLVVRASAFVHAPVLRLSVFRISPEVSSGAVVRFLENAYGKSLLYVGRVDHVLASSKNKAMNVFRDSYIALTADSANKFEAPGVSVRSHVLFRNSLAPLAAVALRFFWLFSMVNGSVHERPLDDAQSPLDSTDNTKGLMDLDAVPLEPHDVRPVMVNLLRYKDEPDARPTYQYGYAKCLMRWIFGPFGIEIPCVGPVESQVGPIYWQDVVLVRYPNKAFFVEMGKSQTYAECHVHREAALADTVLVITLPIRGRDDYETSEDSSRNLRKGHAAQQSTELRPADKRRSAL